MNFAIYVAVAVRALQALFVQAGAGALTSSSGLLGLPGVPLLSNALAELAPSLDIRAIPRAVGQRMVRGIKSLVDTVSLRDHQPTAAPSSSVSSPDVTSSPANDPFWSGDVSRLTLGPGFIPDVVFFWTPSNETFEDPSSRHVLGPSSKPPSIVPLPVCELKVLELDTPGQCAAGDQPTSIDVFHASDQPTSVDVFRARDQPNSVGVFHAGGQPTLLNAFYASHQLTSVDIFYARDQLTSVDVFHARDQPTSVDVIHARDQPTSVDVFHARNQPTSVEVFHACDQPASLNVFQTQDLAKVSLKAQCAPSYVQGLKEWLQQLFSNANATANSIFGVQLVDVILACFVLWNIKDVLHQIQAIFTFLVTGKLSKPRNVSVTLSQHLLDTALSANVAPLEMQDTVALESLLTPDIWHAFVSSLPPVDAEDVLGHAVLVEPPPFDDERLRRTVNSPLPALDSEDVLGHGVLKELPPVDDHEVLGRAVNTSLPTLDSEDVLGHGVLMELPSVDNEVLGHVANSPLPALDSEDVLGHGVLMELPSVDDGEVLGRVANSPLPALDSEDVLGHGVLKELPPVDEKEVLGRAANTPLPTPDSEDVLGHCVLKELPPVDENEVLGRAAHTSRPTLDSEDVLGHALLRELPSVDGDEVPGCAVNSALPTLGSEKVLEYAVLVELPPVDEQELAATIPLSTLDSEEVLEHAVLLELPPVNEGVTHALTTPLFNIADVVESTDISSSTTINDVSLVHAPQIPLPTARSDEILSCAIDTPLQAGNLADDLDVRAASDDLDHALHTRLHTPTSEEALSSAPTTPPPLIPSNDLSSNTRLPCAQCQALMLVSSTSSTMASANRDVIPLASTPGTVPSLMSASATEDTPSPSAPSTIESPSSALSTAASRRKQKKNKARSIARNKAVAEERAALMPEITRPPIYQGISLNAKKKRRRWEKETAAREEKRVRNQKTFDEITFDHQALLAKTSISALSLAESGALLPIQPRLFDERERLIISLCVGDFIPGFIPVLYRKWMRWRFEKEPSLQPQHFRRHSIEALQLATSQVLPTERATNRRLFPLDLANHDPTFIELLVAVRGRCPLPDNVDTAISLCDSVDFEPTSQDDSVTTRDSLLEEGTAALCVTSGPSGENAAAPGAVIIARGGRDDVPDWAAQCAAAEASQVYQPTDTEAAPDWAIVCATSGSISTAPPAHDSPVPNWAQSSLQPLTTTQVRNQRRRNKERAERQTEDTESSEASGSQPQSNKKNKSKNGGKKKPASTLLASGADL